MLFVRRQRRLAEPLLDVRLFAGRSFSAMLIGLSLYGLVGASSMLFITQFLQSVAGLTPFDTALCLLPGMVAGTAGATLSPLLGRVVRPAYLIGGGVLGVAAIFAWFTQLDQGSSPVVLIVGFALMGLFEGPLLSLGTNLVISGAPSEKAGSAASMAQVANEAGGALGVAIMGSIGAAVYVSRLASAPPAAQENVASAVETASRLPPAAAEALLTAAARAAFVDGMTVFAGVSVAVLVVAAVFIVAVLRRVPPTGAPAEIGSQ